MGERVKVYDRQDVIAATTLSADGAPLDGPEIIAGAPISRPAIEGVCQSKPAAVTDFGLASKEAN